MGTKQSEFSTERIVKLTNALVAGLRQAPRIEVVGSYVVQAVVKKCRLKHIIILIDPNLDPLERLRLLMSHSEVALAEAHAEGTVSEDDICQAASTFASMVLSYVPARGWPGDSLGLLDADAEARRMARSVP